MQANGQCQQAGQLQSTPPHLNYNANCSNQGYGNNASYNGKGALEHLTVRNAGASAQRQTNYVPLHHQFPSSHQEYYPNSAQKASNQSNTPDNLNQQMVSQKTSVSGNPQAAVLNNNVLYYPFPFFSQTLHQSPKPTMENASVPRTNPTTSSTMQHVRFTQQSAVQSPMYSQAAQPAACAAPPPTYTQHMNLVFSNAPNAQNVKMYTAKHGTSISTSSVNKLVANNPRVQNSYIVSQTNDNGTVHSVNGSGNLSNQMVTNNGNSQSNSMTVPFLIQCTPFQSIQQISVGGNGNIQIAQPVILATDGRSLNTSSAQLPSQTCLQKQVSVESNLNKRTASLQNTRATKDCSVNQVDNSAFYKKINDVSNSSRSSTCLNQASELSRSEAFAKIDTVSAGQAKDCSLQGSPGRGTRAVAVVLPLSLDGSPSKISSDTSLKSSNSASESCFSSFKLNKKSVQTRDTHGFKKLQKSSSNGSSGSTDDANVQPNLPSLNSKQSSVHDAGVKLSTLPLTFAQLIEGKTPTILSKGRKSKSGNRKIATGQKPCEEGLSSLPTVKWTLRMLHENILELENKEKEKSTDDKHGGCDSAKEVISQYWNGNCRELLNDVKTGTLANEMAVIRNFCSKINIDTVILSQNQNGNLSKYHVLSHGEVYQEKGSYTSSWLNINQLDDIDKEFGLPSFLRFSQDDGKSVEVEPKGKLEDNSQTENKLANPKPEELINKEDFPNPTCGSPSSKSCSNSTDSKRMNESGHLDPETEEKAEEIKCVSDAQSNDSSYLFKIKVLPPEEAKVIFKQIECDSPQIMDKAVSEEIPSNEPDDAEMKKFHITPIENYCCIEKWKGKVFGLSSEGKCKCAEQSQDKEEVKSDYDWPMGTVDLTEFDDDDNDIPLSPQELDNLEEDHKSFKLVLAVSSESDNESQVSESNRATPSDHNEHEHDLVISTESQEDVSTNKNALESANPASSQAASVTNDVEENHTRLASDNPGPVLPKIKLKTLSSNLKTQTILESFSKSKIGGCVETVELALFGSTHKKTASGSSQQSHVPSSHTHTPFLSEKTMEAPKRLFVKFNQFAKSDKQEAEPPEKDSVRKRIHENWRNSFPLATIRLKRKNKKFAIVGANHGTTIQLGSTKHKDKRVGLKRKSRESNDDQCHKKKTFCVSESAVNTLQKPVVEARPLQANVLKFNVLPNTFNFKEGFRDTDSRPDSQTDEKNVPAPPEGSPLIVPAEGSSPGVNSKDAWCDESTSKSSPQSSASVPESAGLFQEFQKRYKMRQTSTED